MFTIRQYVLYGALLIALMVAASPLFRVETKNWEAFAETHADIGKFSGLHRLPAGYQGLRILTPTLLEIIKVSKINTDGMNMWEPPWEITRVPELRPNDFTVMVNGEYKAVRDVGYKRRVLYAAMYSDDFRVGHYTYLELNEPIPQEAYVEVFDAEKKEEKDKEPNFLYTTNQKMHLNPAIHVNQVGFHPDYSKKAIVGYYLGSLGEMDIEEGTSFFIVDAESKEKVFEGVLKSREDIGWGFDQEMYQGYAEADFTELKVSGTYQVYVPGLGTSYSFRINEGVFGALARTYALGLYHQRSGAATEMPFTRFTRGADHTDPAEIPTKYFEAVQIHLDKMTEGYEKNKRHTAPRLSGVENSLYPFVNKGSVDVSGGHHDAGDYSKYMINSTSLVHILTFAVDVLDGVRDLDNLGLPESGDGISDIVQIAKWEADYIAKMQDADGGFYFLVYPRDRKYEHDVLPDDGDPQVVFPKNTSATAAAVAALAQLGSSPYFKEKFPKVSELYLDKAKKGWEFLMKALEKYGWEGSYQKITHYGDQFMHDDEFAWAATEMYLATGDPDIHADLLENYDPLDRLTRQWQWIRLTESYGNAIRSYAFAEKTGRLSREHLDKEHLRNTKVELMDRAKDLITWANGNAYGASFPFENKRFMNAGWYFSASEAFDLMSAAQLMSDAGLEGVMDYYDIALANVNYELGANPNNIVFLTGLGWKRQIEIVHQYAANDEHELPPTGIPIGSFQKGYSYTNFFKKLPHLLSFPEDSSEHDSYPLYDRWADIFNLNTEFTVPIQARGLALAATFMARTNLKDQDWTYLNGQILNLPKRIKVGEHVKVSFDVEGLNVDDAVIVWESSEDMPAFGKEFVIHTSDSGDHWVEVEAQWPDGRRVFVQQPFMVTE